MTATALVEVLPQVVPIHVEATPKSQTAQITISPAEDLQQQETTTTQDEESHEDDLVVTPIHTYLYNMIELGIVRTLFERNVFDAIPVEGAIDIKALAEKTDFELALLSRFIQFLVLAKCLHSPAPGRVAHTEKSQVFLYPTAVNFLSLDVDFFMGPATRWPDYFEKNGYKEPESSKRTPLGLCYGYPDKSIYDVMPLLPGKRAAIFNAAMADTIDEMPFVGFYDFSWIPKHACVDNDPNRTLIVDVGGGKGQALKAIIEENPTISPRRCVLQDQSTSINEAIAEDDVVVKDIAKVISSFFEPQLIKGMRQTPTIQRCAASLAKRI